MSSDRVTRVNYHRKPGFLERVGQSCAGTVVGVALFLASFFLLYYNEGVSIDIARTLDEGFNQVVPFDVNRKLQFNGRLVHLSGYLTTDKVLVDSTYGVAVPCVKLHRKVEMYQWIEHNEVKEVDDGDEIRQETTYTYNTEWSLVLVRSRDFAEEFGHRNPTEIPVVEKDEVAQTVFIDGVRLSSNLLHKINWIQPIEVLPPPHRELDAVVHGKYFYHGKQPTAPNVGDVRVSFHCSGISGSTKVGPHDIVSIIAMFHYDNFAAFPVNNGRSIEFLYRGSKSAKEIFDSEHSTNSARTLLLRVVGFLMMYFGLSLITKVVITLVDWIPIVRGIVSFSVNMFNFSLAASLSLLTIALSWLWHRPLFASSLLAVSFLPWFFSSRTTSSTLRR